MSIFTLVLEWIVICIQGSSKTSKCSSYVIITVHFFVVQERSDIIIIMYKPPITHYRFYHTPNFVIIATKMKEEKLQI